MCSSDLGEGAPHSAPPGPEGGVRRARDAQRTGRRRGAQRAIELNQMLGIPPSSIGYAPPMPWLLACAPKCEPDELSGNGTCTPYTDGTPSDRDVWTPSPGTSWQIQYSGTLDTSLDVDVYDVDLFDTSNADLAALPTKIGRAHV